MAAPQGRQDKRHAPHHNRSETNHTKPATTSRSTARQQRTSTTRHGRPPLPHTIRSTTTLPHTRSPTKSPAPKEKMLVAGGPGRRGERRQGITVWNWDCTRTNALETERQTQRSCGQRQTRCRDTSATSPSTNSNTSSNSTRKRSTGRSGLRSSASERRHVPKTSRGWTSSGIRETYR